MGITPENMLECTLHLGVIYPLFDIFLKGVRNVTLAIIEKLVCILVYFIGLALRGKFV